VWANLGFERGSCRLLVDKIERPAPFFLAKSDE